MRLFQAKMGQRVRMTREAKRQGLQSRKNPRGMGIVIRPWRKGTFLLVRQAGCQSNTRYAPSFWTEALEAEG